MSSSYNERSFVRVEISDQPISLAFGEATVQADLTDISITGLRADVLTDISYETGTPCGVEFFINHQYPVTLAGSLLWHGGGQLGVRFESMDDISFRFLKDFIIACSDRPGEAQQEIDLNTELLPRID